MKSGFFKIGALPVLLISILVIFEPPGVSFPSLTAATLHELGHLSAAKLLGIRLRSLNIGTLGATIKISDSMISYKKEMLLCLAGPLTNIISFSVASCICRSGLYYSASLFNFSAVSLMLGILNLLPIEGFDGGRILYCFCAQHGNMRAASALLSVCSVLSLCLLWIISVYLLLKQGSSLSLFVFSLSIFYRVFVENDKKS